MRPRSRLTLLATGAAAVAVTTVAVAAYLTLSRQLHRDFDDALVARAEAAVTANGDPVQLARVTPGALGSPDLRIAVVAGNAEAVSVQGRSSAPPLDVAELAVAAGNLPRSLRSAQLDGQQFRVAAVRAGTGRALVFAQSTAVVDAQLRSLRLVLLVVGAGAVLAAAGIGLLVGPGSRTPDTLTPAAAATAAAPEEASAAEQGVDGDGGEQQREVGVGDVEQAQRAGGGATGGILPDPTEQPVRLDQEPAAGAQRGQPVHLGGGERPEQQ